MYLNVGANKANGPSPLAWPVNIFTMACLCCSSAFFVINNCKVPSPSWIAFGQDSATITSSPSSLILSPKLPERI
jgi:hypothetical protein